MVNENYKVLTRCGIIWRYHTSQKSMFRCQESRIYYMIAGRPGLNAPVFLPEVWHAAEFADVVCENRHPSGQPLSRDLDIIGTDRQSQTFKIAA